MAHIIALQGPRNCGKTATLKNFLIGMIQQKYPYASKQVISKQSWRDIAVVFDKVNGKIIGINSKGDRPSELESALTDLITRNCDIIFCASSTKGTAKKVSVVAGQFGYTHVYHKKIRVKSKSNYVVANWNDAVTLMQLASI